jgi:hypothetical protein
VRSCGYAQETWVVGVLVYLGPHTIHSHALVLSIGFKRKAEASCERVRVVTIGGIMRCASRVILPIFGEILTRGKSFLAVMPKWHRRAGHHLCVFARV